MMLDHFPHHRDAKRKTNHLHPHQEPLTSSWRYVQKKRNESRIHAVVGPTNTGKTTLLLSRMVGYETGIAGFPLRLLARENYDRLCATHNRDHVALITGEEQIIPSSPRWYITTLEAMPDIEVDFIAVDEIQLIGDRVRGHVFTDRLLHWRGNHETLFCGSDIAVPLLRRLVPNIDISHRPRLSQLNYGGAGHLLHTLPPRSAVVAFSTNDVVMLAASLRAQQKSVALVAGFLSPTVRALQVEMFNNQQADYMVATDAIGMGLNLMIDRVYFSSAHKFDGEVFRPLHPWDIGQIAGRAGRGRLDGIFALMDNVDISPKIIKAVANQHFPALSKVLYRSPLRDYSSIAALEHSLLREPPDLLSDSVIIQRNATDQLALRYLISRRDVTKKITSEDQCKILWQVCQLSNHYGDNHRFFNTLTWVVTNLLDHHHHIIAGVIEKTLQQKIDNTSIPKLIQYWEHMRMMAAIARMASWFGRDYSTNLVDMMLSAEKTMALTLDRMLKDRFVVRKQHLTTIKSMINEILPEMSGDGGISFDGRFFAKRRGLMVRMLPWSDVPSLSHTPMDDDLVDGGKTMIKDSKSVHHHHPVDILTDVNTRFKLAHRAMNNSSHQLLRTLVTDFSPSVALFADDTFTVEKKDTTTNQHKKNIKKQGRPLEGQDTHTNGVTHEGLIAWNGDPIAKLVKSGYQKNVHGVAVILLPHAIDSHIALNIADHLQQWLDKALMRYFYPVFSLRSAVTSHEKLSQYRPWWSILWHQWGFASCSVVPTEDEQRLWERHGFRLYRYHQHQTPWMLPHEPYLWHPRLLTPVHQQWRLMWYHIVNQLSSPNNNNSSHDQIMRRSHEATPEHKRSMRHFTHDHRPNPTAQAWSRLSVPLHTPLAALGTLSKQQHKKPNVDGYALRIDYLNKIKFWWQRCVVEDSLKNKETTDSSNSPKNNQKKIPIPPMPYGMNKKIFSTWLIGVMADQGWAVKVVSTPKPLSLVKKTSHSQQCDEGQEHVKQVKPSQSRKKVFLWQLSPMKGENDGMSPPGDTEKKSRKPKSRSKPRSKPRSKVAHSKAVNSKADSEEHSDVPTSTGKKQRKYDHHRNNKHRSMKSLKETLVTSSSSGLQTQSDQDSPPREPSSP